MQGFLGNRSGELQSLFLEPPSAPAKSAKEKRNLLKNSCFLAARSLAILASLAVYLTLQFAWVSWGIGGMQILRLLEYSKNHVGGIRE